MKCSYCGISYNQRPDSGKCFKCGNAIVVIAVKPLPAWKGIDHKFLLVRFISNFPEFATGTPPNGTPLDHVELIQWLGNEVHALVPEAIRACMATHGTPYDADELDDPNDFTVCASCGGYIRRR
jgi:hypothetical protein